MKTIRRVGILELCAQPARAFSKQVVDFLERKQYVGVTPQVISVWCRQLGYEVYYATYYGIGDPKSRLPRDLDLVIISTYSGTAPLAYALGLAYRLDGVRTVCGGPHTRAYPHDTLRYFDLVVLECDKNLIADILHDRFALPSIVSSEAPCAEVPTLEERLPEIRASVFWGGRPFIYGLVPMLASAGCPFSCGFCSDWNRPHRTFSLTRLAADLQYAGEHMPGMKLFFCDPNFGIHFNETLAAFESVPPERRNPYIFQTALTNVRQPDRLQRLRDTHCMAIAPGIESWTDYSHKAGLPPSAAWEKMNRLVDQLQNLSTYIPYIQANFIFGLDTDAGDEPFELTKEFLRRTPCLFPTLTVPVAFGGTPLYRGLEQEGRILKTMPFSFYWTPYLMFIPKNYDALAYYRHMVDLYAMVVSDDMLRRRLTAKTPRYLKTLNTYRTFAYRVILDDLRKIAHRLETDRDFRLFHSGQVQILPPAYARAYRQELGRYAELMPGTASQPVFESDETPAAFSRQPASRLTDVPPSPEVAAAGA